VPLCSIPEALLSDRGTNRLLILMQNVSRLLGIKKLNTTAHHLQCDCMIKRLNGTSKVTYVAETDCQVGAQWDTYLLRAL